jgi:hypothetical protein
VEDIIMSDRKGYYPHHPKPKHPHKDPIEIEVKDARAEEGEHLVFKVKFDAPAEKPFVIKYSTYDITAKAPGDYTAEPKGQVHVKKGDTYAEIKVATTEDYVHESTETMGLKIYENSPWVKIKDGEAIGTIKDDDARPQHYKLYVGDAYAKEGEYLYFKVSINGKADHKIDFNWTTKDITTEGAADYTPTYGSGSIAEGSSHGVIKILAKTDYLKEGYEHFKVHVTENDDYVKVKDGEGHGTIKDVYHHHYSKPTVKIDDAHAQEGDKMSFKVHAEHNYHGVKVYYRTEAGTANEYGNHTKDYHPAGGGGKSLYLAPGQKEGVIYVDTKEDYYKEDTEYFKMILEDGHYKKGDDYAKGIIYDDDSVATIATGMATDMLA